MRGVIHCQGFAFSYFVHVMLLFTLHCIASNNLASSKDDEIIESR
jgi:hypothetical protein